jgi:NAD(P)-dependent dehydrogenase (short-subunit alcohol dehydrogenase family)
MLNTQMAPYGPSKAAAEALSAIMANDLKGTGVTVNVVIPGGPTDTQMVAVKASVPRSSLLPPEVMAPPILWLLSPEASQTSGKRFIAWKWDKAAPGAMAATGAGAPVAWTSLASGSMRRPAV